MRNRVFTFTAERIAELGYEHETLVADSMYIFADDLFNKHKEQIVKDCKKNGRLTASEIANKSVISVNECEDRIIRMRVENTSYEINLEKIFSLYHKWCSEFKIKEATFGEISEYPHNVNGFDLFKVCSEERLRPSMNCIYFKEGSICATDAHIVVRVKMDYPSDCEGRLLKRDFTFLDDCRYPNVDSLLRCDGDKINLNLAEFDRLFRLSVAKNGKGGTSSRKRSNRFRHLWAFEDGETQKFVECRYLQMAIKIFKKMDFDVFTTSIGIIFRNEQITVLICALHDKQGEDVVVNV